MTNYIAYFPKTIIFLPLRVPAQARTSRLSSWSPSILDVDGLIRTYFDMARLSLFCTSLRSISGKRRQADGVTVIDVWTVQAEFSPETLSTGPCSCLLRLYRAGSHHDSKETWHLQRCIIDRTTLPPELHQLVRMERFPLTLIASLSATSSSRSRILASVPMPVTTALPIHISAPFVVASDRRSLRYD